MKKNFLHVKIESLGNDRLDFNFLEGKTIVISQKIINVDEIFPNTKTFYLSAHYRIDKKNMVFYLVNQQEFGNHEVETFLKMFDHSIWYRFLRPFCIAINSNNVKSIVIECVTGQPNYLKLHIDVVTQLVLQKTTFFSAMDHIQFLFSGYTNTMQ